MQHPAYLLSAQRSAPPFHVYATSCVPAQFLRMQHTLTLFLHPSMVPTYPVPSVDALTHLLFCSALPGDGTSRLPAQFRPSMGFMLMQPLAYLPSSIVLHR
jgi:hypothetical protein